VAGYAKGVLTRWQQVEDNLAALRVLSHGERFGFSRPSILPIAALNLSSAQYKAVTIQSYPHGDHFPGDVVGASKHRVRTARRLLTRVFLLVEALDGGWDFLAV